MGDHLDTAEPGEPEVILTGVASTAMSVSALTLVDMADIEILEVRAYEARCIECGETGPIESSAFWAMAWEEAHVCVAVRIDTEATALAAAS
ncbi:hypothetical protein BH11ACT3_BH11ACT3_24470 [soil metagenome]